MVSMGVGCLFPCPLRIVRFLKPMVSLGKWILEVDAEVDGASEVIVSMGEEDFLEEGNDGVILDFFEDFAGCLGGGRLCKFLSNSDVSHIRSSTVDSIRAVMSGTSVMYSGMIK